MCLLLALSVGVGLQSAHGHANCSPSSEWCGLSIRTYFRPHTVSKCATVGCQTAPMGVLKDLNGPGAQHYRLRLLPCDCSFYIVLLQIFIPLVRWNAFGDAIHPLGRFLSQPKHALWQHSKVTGRALSIRNLNSRLKLISTPTRFAEDGRIECGTACRQVADVSAWEPFERRHPPA